MKKFFLFLIVLAEIVVGSLGLWVFYQLKIVPNQKANSSKIAKIDQTKIVQPTAEGLRYYYEFLPNQKYIDSVSWLKNDISHNINADGLDDSFDYDVSKGEGVFRIIALGDSFTFGQNVETDKIWSEVLEKELSVQAFSCPIKKVEVINLGMPGFDVQEIVRRYERIGQKYNPDLIIYFESGSGFVRFNEIMQPKIADCLQEGDEKLDLKKSSDEIKVTKCWDQGYEYVLHNYSLDQRAKMMEEQFDRLVNLDEVKHINFYYYSFYWTEKGYDYMPILEQWRKKYPQANFVSDLGFMANNKDYEYIDGHPNIAGHADIAMRIKKT